MYRCMEECLQLNKHHYSRYHPMRKAAHFVCFLAPYGANFAYDGVVPVSQV
jgi:hypothetical protein